MSQTLPPTSDTLTRPGAVAEPEGAPGGEEAIYVASQRKLVWWALKKHKLAMAGLFVTLVFYLVAVFVEFLAPYDTRFLDAKYVYAPPQRLHVIDRSADGQLQFGLYVNGYKTKQNPETLELTYVPDPTKKVPVRLFDSGPSYKLWGFIPSDLHLIGPVNDNQPMYLLGADRTGHDLLSRLIYGTRISMSIGLVGVAVSFILGVAIGGISGYFSGIVDTLVQRLIEFFSSLPTIPLWLGLAAALPAGLGPLKRYFYITVILSLIAWTHLARVVRGRFLSLREEEFVTAAHLDASSQPRIIFRHILPSFTSHLIAALTLAIPTMILAETSLSFLGLGLQAPVVSWGVLLQEAQQVRVIATAPWLLIPGIAVMLAVLALNFFGDGLRDAADPYKR
jgi:peptide/nickel transport system permease protein